EDFCNSTEYYKNTSRRFLNLVNKIETANVSPDRIASAVLKALKSKHPRYVYNVNRSILLKMLNALPQRMQNSIIKRVLSNK
ncbi:MAG: hypothetical protein IKS77_04260, partial [Spirochaetales bacterium]|nr:hypothetical protein [Spirochaetales bacterium]